MNATFDRRLRRLAMVAGPGLMLLSASYAALGGVVSVDRYVAFFVVSGSFLAAGLIAWHRRPANRTGKLLVAIGLCVALAPIRGLPWPLLTPVGIISASASHALLGYLLLAFPSGELRSTWSRALVALTAVLLVVPRLVSLAAFDPSSIGLDYVNPYLVIRDASIAAGTVAVAALIEFLVVVGYVGALAVRWWRGSEPARRVLSPVLVPALMVAVIRSAETASRVGGPAGLQEVLFTAQFLAHAAIPLGFLIGLLRTRMARSLIADLVVELGETPAPARLRDALAHALGDRALTVAYWSAASDTFVDADGRRVDLPADGSGRAVTRLERDGTPLAAIIHDAALLDDPGLVASVASAMRLAVENERLQAQVEEQLVEVRASRVRIVEAGDAERKRVERDLHDGAQQRLVSLTLALRLVRTKLGQNPDPAVGASLDQATDDARAALAELRELARGIHPAILSQAGLGAAIESLADRSPVDVRVEVAADERFSPAVEATAYFVVSEALANVAKYAKATQATVRATRDGQRLTVEVADDGIGGADVSRGSGLRGLADRLSAIDGTMELDSPAGMGTRLLARIPIGPAAEVPG
jgi:signal transduction histidine kinase